MKIKSVALDRCQAGWRCTVRFSAETGEIREVAEEASWWPIAVWRGLRAAGRPEEAEVCSGR